MQAFVPKNRRPKFELHLKILDLNNVPLVSGTAYVKWHLPFSASAEHRGRTSKSVIKDHKVQWDYSKVIPVRLTVDKNSMLQESEIYFEVTQEYSSGARSERITLGNVKLNLAEYVEGDGGDEGTTRRYLMRESKINSTLKISILMKQTEGDKNFFAPPLKSAPVFGGIAGIMSNEQTEQDDVGHISASFKLTENRELQDIYRRTLAASFAAQAGELPADECIESIFAGGDGWRHPPKANDNSVERDERMRGSSSAFSGRSDSQQRHYRHAFRSSSRDARHKSQNLDGRSSSSGNLDMLDGGTDGSGSTGQRGRSSRMVDEFDVWENLRSWRLPLSG